MRHPLRSIALSCLTLLGGALAAAEPKEEAGKKSRSELMDYGSFITATIGQGKEQATAKGVAVRLADHGHEAFVCFDTEGLRVSAAWTGTYLDFKGLPFKGGWDNARGPNIPGPIQIATPAGPGWAGPAGFADPREHGDGPLPLSWGRYRGLYRHGDQVVFAYTVGPCPVLELPSVHFERETAVFVRTLHLGASPRPLALLVAALPGAQGATAHGAMLTAGAQTISADGAGLPAGAVWKVDEGRIVLTLPALAAPTTIRIAFAGGADAAALAAALAGPAADVEALTKGGPTQWAETITTAGTLGKDGGDFAVDTLTLPEKNPWNAWMRATAFDVFPDGRIALCTWSGDVWIVSGVDATLGTLTWRRFASGLFQPLGLKIVDSTIYVLCHGPIMRLHDLDGDGEADFYECFNNDCAVTNSYHEFACDLQTDSHGDFWFTKGAPALVGREKFERYTHEHGTVLKVAKDGSALQVMGTGFREPNGLCVGPGDLITVTDNQGNWQPGCPIDLIHPGGFYGMPDPASTAARPQRDPPLCWLPYGMDNSSGGQVWVSGERWAALQGEMLLTSYGKCALFTVLMDPPPAPGVLPVQSLVARLPLAFESGIMRARFSPADGQLYVCGMRGWGTAASKDGTLQRVRMTGKPLHQATGFHVAKGAITLTFSCALDPRTAGEADSYSAEIFTMVESKAYGSPEFSVADPKKKGRDPLPITGATLSADGRSVTLAIPTLAPVMGLMLKVRIEAKDGASIDQELAGTINRMP